MKTTIVKKKALFIGLGCSLAGLLLLALGCMGAILTGGTRLLYFSSTWGGVWRHYPWLFLAALVLLAVGIPCLLIGWASRVPAQPEEPVIPAVPGAPGEPVRPANAIPTPPPAKVAPKGAKVCPNCGAACSGKFCMTCGAKLED